MSQVPKEWVEPGPYQDIWRTNMPVEQREEILCTGAGKLVCLVRIKGVSGDIAEKK